MKSEGYKFRHELKFMISEAEKDILIKRLSFFMQADAHAKGNETREDIILEKCFRQDECTQKAADSLQGGYMIRSLYFDDRFERAYEEKLAGVKSRKKYRIRIYNCSDKVIKLECKHKEGQYIHKTAAALTREEADALIAGRYDFLIDRKEQLCREFYFECAMNGMAPKVVVDYDRIPFVYPYGDVRITFDCRVRTGMLSDNLFDNELPVKNVMQPGMLIMEVKFTEYLPELIRSLLPVADSAYMAYSKYTMCLEKKKELSCGY